MPKNSIFRIVFIQEEDLCEIYAKQVAESDMFGFLLIEDFIFGEKSQVVVDPQEEKLKALFSGVKRTYVPMQSILRIDEVDKEGPAKLKHIKGASISRFPQNPFPPSTKGSD